MLYLQLAQNHPKLYFYDCGLAAWLIGIREPRQITTFHPEMANTLIKWATIAEPITQLILIYDGDEKFQFKGIEVVPWRMVGRDERDNVLTG